MLNTIRLLLPNIKLGPIRKLKDCSTLAPVSGMPTPNDPPMTAAPSFCG